MCRCVLPQYAAHWKEIGIFLGIQLGQLAAIQANNPANVNGCCTELFIKWLNGVGNVTWEKMFEAIDQATISFSIDSTAIPTTGTSKQFWLAIFVVCINISFVSGMRMLIF